jgi:hypothetical protein
MVRDPRKTTEVFGVEVAADRVADWLERTGGLILDG